MNEIKYDPEIEDQIKAQQKAIANIQISTAQAKQAQQDAITAEAQGQAKAATAKWEKEVLRTAATVAAQQEKDVAVLNASRDKEVAETAATRDKVVALTAANRDREVAELRKETADNEKQAAILRGEGEARARELVMSADGALKQKLDAWLEAQKAYASAIGSYKGAWVPSVVMGASNGSNTNAAGGAQQLIDMLTAKTARDLGLSLDVTAPAQAK